MLAVAVMMVHDELQHIVAEMRTRAIQSQLRGDGSVLVVYMSIYICIYIYKDMPGMRMKRKLTAAQCVHTLITSCRACALDACPLMLAFTRATLQLDEKLLLCASKSCSCRLLGWRARC